MTFPVQWPYQGLILERMSWKLQSTVTIGLVALSSKIFIGT